MDEGVKFPGETELPKPVTNVPSGKGRRPSRRLLWLSLAGLFIAGFIAWLWWESVRRAPPQIITLPNGERYQFAGVTYGTNAVPPYFPARLVRWLPKRLTDPVEKFFGQRISQFNMRQPFDGPKLFIWFRHPETNPPAAGKSLSFAVRAHLADESGVEAGVTSYPVFVNGVTWSFAEFPVFPRRSRMLRLNLYPFASDGSLHAPVSTVSLRNPMYGLFPQWQPEPVPMSKPAGDLTVRLDDLINGRPGAPTLRGEEDPQTGFAMSCLAGNTDETAIGTTNFPHLTNIIGGVPVVLTEFVRKPDVTSNAMGFFGMTSEVRVELPGKPADAALDFWSMSTDAGQAVKYVPSYPPFAYVVLLRSIPANARTMTFTFVVQKIRSVEFLVKPPKPD